MSEQPGRYQRSTSGMIGALLVTLLVILAFVGFRALNRSDLDVKPERVDYLAQVRYAQQAGSDVVYLSREGEYVGIVESPESAPELVTTYVDPHPQAGAPATVDGSVVRRWNTWTDSGGDTALVARRGHGSSAESLLVFGSVPRAELEQLAASLTTAAIPGGG